jgi:hypothetical protein
VDAAAEYRALLAATPGAVQVTSGSLPAAWAVLDFNGQGLGPEGAAQPAVQVPTLTFCTPDLPGLEPGSVLDVDGSAYQVAQGPFLRGDGVESVAELQEAP